MILLHTTYNTVHGVKFINHMNRNGYGPNKTFPITLHSERSSSVSECHYGHSIQVAFPSWARFNCVLDSFHRASRCPVGIALFFQYVGLKGFKFSEWNEFERVCVCSKMKQIQRISICLNGQISVQIHYCIEWKLEQCWQTLLWCSSANRFWKQL